MVFRPIDELHDFETCNLKHIVRETRPFFCLITNSISTCFTVFSARLTAAQFGIILVAWCMEVLFFLICDADISGMGTFQNSLGRFGFLVRRHNVTSRRCGKLTASVGTWKTRVET